MWFMTVETAHLLFTDRVMGKEAELCSHIRMATITKFRHLIVTDSLLRPFVQGMTAEAAQVIQCMNTGMPVR